MKTAKELAQRGEVLCALCKGTLTVHGCYRRHYKDETSKRHYGWVAQGHCGVCNKYPALIPDFLMPYKHYETAVIERVITGSEESESLSEYLVGSDCTADESTMRRWINQFKGRGARAVGCLLSVLFTIYGRCVGAVELKNKGLLKQLARLTGEYPVPKSGLIIGRANIILTMHNCGCL